VEVMSIMNASIVAILEKEIQAVCFVCFVLLCRIVR
jgi:hypothetical protein